MPDKKPDLEAAYSLQTPDDNRALYADWAESYDSDFAESQDYRLPQRTAEVFLKTPRTPGPVLDVGAGTGLLARHLPDEMERHGLDISADMLRMAAENRLYSRVIEADLTQKLSIEDETYGGIVSSGTFTHGHVGPDALDELLRIAKPGAGFALSINTAHYASKGFARKFEALRAAYTVLDLTEVEIYGPAADPAHRNDTAIIAAFTKR